MMITNKHVRELASAKGFELREISGTGIYKNRRCKVYALYRDNALICTYSTLVQIEQYLTDN